MKYSSNNKPLVCMMTNSTCYKSTRTMTVKGILWHSTGANNPNLRRYVQPSTSDANYNSLMKLLGTNTAKNDWNHIYHEAGLNAWIGKLADGTITTVQTMPWNYRPWGCGSGRYGSCNNGWIQFEICEDSLTDKNYFNKVYKEACELTAYLCKMYNLNPTGYTTTNGVKVPVILCHQDSYRLGLGGNHGDVYHWFNKHGKTMDDVRKDVAALMNGGSVSTSTPSNSSSTSTAKPSINTSKTKLDVDGSFGRLTVLASQKYFCTTQDGEISNQPTSNKKYLESAVEGVWEFKSSGYSAGSYLVRAMQKKFGTTVDGFFGRNSVKSMQKWLNTKGYNCGVVDGYMGKKTVSAWQRFLNDNLK